MTSGGSPAWTAASRGSWTVHENAHSEGADFASARDSASEGQKKDGDADEEEFSVDKEDEGLVRDAAGTEVVSCMAG